MIPAPRSSAPPQFLAWQPLQSAASSFWQPEHVHEQLRKLKETIDLMKAVQKELEEIHRIRSSSQDNADRDNFSSFDHLSERKILQSSNDTIARDAFQHVENDILLQFSETVKAKMISLNAQETFAMEAASSIFSTLKNQLTPFSVITNQASSWEERLVAVKLAQKLQKSRRNQRWKKRKRKRVAELIRKEREGYEKADQEADEWRMREIANDIARRKAEKLKEIAKLKANEEKRRLESELELVLIVEKLQELRSIRIQKLKKQGHFLPEEDDKFLERVQAAVEEEERQAAAAADTNAAKDAIATAEESRKAIHSANSEANDVNHNKGVVVVNEDQLGGIEGERSSDLNANLKSEQQKVEGQNCGGGYDFVANLPFEFYHYYHGSSNDMGTLIEVRKMWDAYIRPGGSRIPGHWVQPPQPSDEVWASYLVHSKQ
ncbi:U11/U12 small nuclear ribonucleoprotein 59 kDa protein [Phoenix dactylifera]|uniref:U11/U12 small nuclear ribonucleoprotein 59 kDa protein n=1 Tax=Phoenix dactylifera TaxID=42345 RepID=A0A8B7CBA7_PHODC|nr:U11/U12 small nuclear ribonucleoprotein 59 kDa protein [Phoenix dactylifera]XP_008795690.1 U11/U12 small nuclear ribonucleoprotein 59 kDa protein [Phoenix dactylifera]XP_008795760.1 U11/U12 small nuclear ribonucleoprotein 59 kDa protein [Phoenix dactylifera]XP_008795827.1 U11/U12 small nuclear ribonucleoprotein 59 kDa protein [Phoenix dactylifera]XP_038986203.1 U11/U12 small nuclear ribonucleoprotein 59 kDa protein [Phoenix dactylifera]XP_038986204.1 U11/U12 small nuclear ribonucleoprotein 